MKVKLKIPMKYIRIIMLMPLLFWACNKKEDPTPPNPCDDAEEWYETKRAAEAALAFAADYTNMIKCEDYVKAYRAFYDRLEREECPSSVEEYQTFSTLRGLVSGDINSLCSVTGQVAFYTEIDHGCGNVEVTVNQYGSKSITKYFSSDAPNCGDSGTATWTLAPGTYSFTASCGRWSWDGDFTITRGVCLQYRLY